MLLTDKALFNFKYWFRTEYALNDFRAKGFILGIDDFFNLPKSMQWGVYVDFFEANDIDIECTRYIDVKTNKPTYRGALNTDDVKYYDRLTDARVKIIKRANEYYNKNR